MEIKLSRGQTAVVDDEDLPLVGDSLWKAMNTKHLWYAVRHHKVDGRNRAVLMHREILGLTHRDGMEVDHIDGNGLNNRRANLRVCTHAENAKNRKKSVRSNTLYKGVYVHAGCVNRFRARITVNGVRINLGSFGSQEEAHAAYMAASEKYHGGFGSSGVRDFDRSRG